MIKVAVLDDYQNVFEEIIDIEKFKNKFDFKIFNEAFNDEKEAIEIANDVVDTIKRISLVSRMKLNLGTNTEMYGDKKLLEPATLEATSLESTS